MNNKGILTLLSAKIEEEFKIIGGIRIISFTVNNQVIEDNKVTYGSWQKLMANCGKTNIIISGNGILVDNKMQDFLFANSLEKNILYYKIYCSGGCDIEGEFFISKYNRSGVYQDQELYKITLESSGVVKLI